MKFIRTITLIVGIALIFTACKQESDQPAVAVKANTNPLLNYVPADTAYVFAPLEPIPKEITDAYIARFQPVKDVIAEQVAQFQTDFESGDYEGNEMAALAMAVLDELGGSLSADSLEKFGISLQTPRALYAMGIFPVMRLGLSDAQELRNAIARIESKMGFEMPEKDLNGSAYWRVAEEGMPVGIYIAVLDQQLALSAFPVNAEDSLLAAFLGQEMPAQSMASSNALAIMNSKNGYTNYGSGIIDLQKLAAELLNPDSATRAYFGPDSGLKFPNLDAVCITEVKSMVAKAPRMTGGITKLTANEIALRYELEIENSLAVDLASLVSDTPVAAYGDHLFSGSLAIQVGKLRSFLLEKANAIGATPYQCEMLQELNQGATELVTQLNFPMPPMVNNLKGARIMVDDFKSTAAIPEVSGLAAIHVDKPEMFAGLASMVVPGFENLDLANQSDPVRIPAEMLPIEGVEVFALMSDTAIGASIGEQQAKGLSAFMAAKPQDNGTFFSFSYDLARQAEIQSELAQKWTVDSAEQGSPIVGLAEAIRESYTAMRGRSRVDMRLSGNGLVIDSRMTFE